MTERTPQNELVQMGIAFDALSCTTRWMNIDGRPPTVSVRKEDGSGYTSFVCHPKGIKRIIYALYVSLQERGGEWSRLADDTVQTFRVPTP